MHRGGGRRWDKVGSGDRPWWTFPTPLGVPRVADSVMPCFGDEVITPTGEKYAMHVECGPFLPGSHLGNAQDWDNYWKGAN